MRSDNIGSTRQDRQPTYIIAEMACSHEGDMNLAKKIIDGAGRAGAQAIQFQIWEHTEVVVPDHKDFELMKGLQFSQPDWLSLKNYVRTNYPEMDIIACVSEPGSAEFANDFGADAFKIHSSDLSNPTMLRWAANTGKRIDLSIGGSTIEEIDTAIEIIRQTSASEIWLMYGLQLFPTTPENVHLNYMMKLASLFELPVGYQDHTDGDEPGAFYLPAAAMGLGVNILEKHITHDRGFKGVDHEAALDPEEFFRFTAMVREIESAGGLSAPHPFSDAENRYRIYSKKSIVAARDIPSGTALRNEDICLRRANDIGLPPDRAETLLGRKTNRDIPAYALMREEDLG